MADYEVGKMDISEQREMYSGFTRALYRSSILIAAILLLMYVFLT